MTDFKREFEFNKMLEELATELSATCSWVFTEKGNHEWVEVARRLQSVALDGFNEIATLAKEKKEHWILQLEVAEALASQQRQNGDNYEI